MRVWTGLIAVASALVMYGACAAGKSVSSPTAPPGASGGATDGGAASPDAVKDFGAQMIEQGRQTFRFDTFGDEAFWTDTLQLNKSIADQAHGGTGAGLAPNAALQSGLKVDVDALPQSVINGLKAGQVDLTSNATTLALLQANAVVGLKASFDGQNLGRVGITCALCHSTVDDSLAPGVGHRLDGWPNRDLNVGAIVSLAPDAGLQKVADLLHAGNPRGPSVTVADVKAALGAWGPGKFDAELLMDGKTTNPNTGKSSAALIPAAFGLAGVNLHTYTGWGSIPHWNAFVANLEMHGQGTFYDPRLDDAAKFPVAAANRFGHLSPPLDQDQVTAKLPALHYYQLSLDAPKPPASFFNADGAQRGKAVFEGKAKCASCHVPPLFTEPGWNMHLPSEIKIDDFQAKRSPDERYRTTPLRGLFARMKSLGDPNGHGFYHDGRFATLQDVVRHYNDELGLGLTESEQADLIEYLKSL